MANTLGISISESFLQLGLKEPDAPEFKSQSYFLPKVALPRAIEDFFSKFDSSAISSIRAHLKSPRFILKRHLGAPPAVLVTAGFEDWLDMNLPVVEPQFRLHPRRAESPLDRDLVFGVSERVDAQGNVVAPVSDDELEFLASKLKMLAVENVALCFLHSNKNRENLEKTKRFLEQQGLKVFVTSSSVEDEKSRWWTSILAAYLQPFYEQSQQQLRETLPENLRELPIEISTASGFSSSEELFPMNSLFGEIAHLKSQLKSKLDGVGYITHFGLEDFYSFDLEDPASQIWNSPYGKVAMTVPGTRPLKLQPTAVIESNFWGVPAVTSRTVGFEPGPMCLGRGLRPTLLDVLFLTGELNSVSFLNSYFNEKSMPRIRESLIAMCEDPNKELTTRDVINSTLELAMRQILIELDGQKKNVFIGPLASFFKQKLRKLEPNLKIDVLDENTELPLAALLDSTATEAEL